MKTMFRNAIRTKFLALAPLLLAGSLQADQSFIDFTSKFNKPTFENVDVTVNGVVVSVMKTTITQTTNLVNGTIVGKTMTEVLQPTAAGGFEKLVVKETKTATLDSQSNTYTVITTSTTTTIPADASGDQIGASTTALNPSSISNSVTFANIGIPPVLTFSTPTVALDPPVTISAE
jgi:hypothetical protein